VSGILNVTKPRGPTSFDIVRTIRRGTGEKRVGHAGTLDPAASGVLLVLLGQASRITEYLMDLPKVYRATVQLGVTTTTYDAEGEATSRSEVRVSERELDEVLSEFVGEIQQRPPAYSALKIGGEAAYRLARRGDQPEMKPRPARIYRINLLTFDPPHAEIEVECGRGTYIRSLANDIGQRLGCGAHLAALERSRVGPFTVERALPMDDIVPGFADGTWREFVEPMDCGLINLPALTVPIDDENDLRHGQAVDLDTDTTARLPECPDRLEARGYAEDGSLIGILLFDAASGMWRPRKIFAREVAR
jgi:tRNA pseudouridine55 synthase